MSDCITANAHIIKAKCQAMEVYRRHKDEESIQLPRKQTPSCPEGDELDINWKGSWVGPKSVINTALKTNTPNIYSVSNPTCSERSPLVYQLGYDAK
jgi:hypothetical protein